MIGDKDGNETFFVLRVDGNETNNEYSLKKEINSEYNKF